MIFPGKSIFAINPPRPGNGSQTCSATGDRRNAGTPSKALMSRCRRPGH
jgi:hypothetical protein